jgi:hypothetical protein
MPHEFDDFDTQIQPEELWDDTMLMPEDIEDDNPIDDDFMEQEPYDGEDYNNWEEQQVFLDNEFE